MSIRTGTRLLTVCAGIAGAGTAAVLPAAAAEAPPTSVDASVTSDLDTAGTLGTGGGGQGHPAGLPVGGGLPGELLGGLPTGGLPLGG
ncbi:hypothetical protein [Streptomyces roseolilacinus]|uniref:ATP-binding protein n=1 Tax=Streptomyces roseolilacinus TaxID=66904 RepID=A0A918AWP8_9ACTN|nr:hypothetical protein [Streptomyces roseolilacinus]GGP95239.1 hypothetical protein GCM10010249_11570 [Streptomyces roseolilacinus]